MAEAKTKKSGKKSDKDLVAKIRDRYKSMHEADQDNRRKALDDLKFCFEPGAQWDDASRKDRGDRPCYEFNKIRPTVKRVINEMRKNRPQGKVRAVEDGDKDTADVQEGLIRNIWNTSDADTVIDYAGEYQVAGGMGAWRITTKYAGESAFDQDIAIEAIKNPFCLYADNACADPLKRDARDWILTDKISKEVYETKYKGVDVVEFDAMEFDDDSDWRDEDSVRICEYWWKEPVTKEIYLLQGGQTVDTIEGVDPMTIVRSRTVNTHKIMMCIASGDAILEGPTEWVGSQFPFVIIYGDWIVIDGKVCWNGLTRHAKDAQRSYNYARTAIAETIALAPQAKYLATAKQITGLEATWAEAHKKNFPFLLYNPDEKSPGPPVRVGGADVPVALMQESQIASEEIKAVTGIYDASLGAHSNETSGRAIMARQAQGDVATYNFSDNMAKGIRRTYELLVDLIPKVYDSERSIRILGVDGAEKYAKVNETVVDPATGQVTVINDLSRGRYDVAVTVGPSFATQRMEAAETYTNIMQAMPEMAPAIADLAIKAMDLPYSDQVAERMQAMLPPQIQQMINKDKPLPPEVQAAMMQVDQAMQQVQQHGQLVQQAASELEQSKAEDTKAKAEIKAMMADLDAKRAQFEAAVATAEADLKVQAAQIQVQEANLATNVTKAHSEVEQGAIEREKESLTEEAREAVQSVSQLAAQFMQQVTQVVAHLQSLNAAPKPRVVRIERQGGAMIPVYEDQVA